MKLRLFIGLTAPPEWKAEIGDWRRRIAAKFSDSFGRWTSDENLHLTLRFFGSIEEADVVSIGDALQKVVADTKPFSLSAGGLGCFPNASRPRIVWLGFKGACDALVDLEKRVRESTGQFGQPPEDRDFHPHLTLARVKEARGSDRDVLAELIRKGSPIDVLEWPIRELELIRSELKPGGSRYTKLMGYRLGA